MMSRTRGVSSAWMLEKTGYDVLEAHDGERASELMNTGENRLMLDVVLCDIRMPKVDGLFTAAYLRNEFPHVPVLMLTGFPDTEMAVTCLCEGAVRLFGEARRGRATAISHIPRNGTTWNGMAVMYRTGKGEYVPEPLKCAIELPWRIT